MSGSDYILHLTLKEYFLVTSDIERIKYKACLENWKINKAETCNLEIKIP